MVNSMVRSRWTLRIKRLSLMETLFSLSTLAIPAEIDYTEYGIKDALVVDNTGIWKDEAGLGQHTSCPGASKALLTAPAKGEIKNIVYGINDDLIEATDTIIVRSIVHH